MMIKYVIKNSGFFASCFLVPLKESEAWIQTCAISSLPLHMSGVPCSHHFLLSVPSSINLVFFTFFLFIYLVCCFVSPFLVVVVVVVVIVLIIDNYYFYCCYYCYYQAYQIKKKNLSKTNNHCIT